MQPLHHQDDDAPLLVVEPCAERAVVPVDDPFACCFGGAVLGLQGVVDDDEVRTAAGDRAAHRQGDPAAAFGRDRLGPGFRLEAHPGKDPPVPLAFGDHAELPGELVGETLAVADAQEALGRIMAQRPGRECDRGADRLEGAGRLRDQQPPVLACMAARQLVGDGLDVPVGPEGIVGRHRGKHLAHEQGQVRAQGGVEFIIAGHRHHPLLEKHRSLRRAPDVCPGASGYRFASSPFRPAAIPSRRAPQGSRRLPRSA